VAAVAAVVGEDVDIGAAATAGTEAALEQVVTRGTSAEETGSSSPLLVAVAMLTHGDSFTRRGGVSASNRPVSVRYITATFDDV
jgi:hypothetical protein